MKVTLIGTLPSLKGVSAYPTALLTASADPADLDIESLGPRFL